MIRKLLSVGILVLVSASLQAQEPCTSHTITQRWMEQHGQSTDLTRAAKKVTKGDRKGGGTPTIAVAVHVVWNTAAENVADALILDMIATMNEDYQAQNSDWDNVRPAFESDRANPDLLFCLAQTDPNGNATTGITRTQTTETWFDPDNETDDMKSAPDGIAGWDAESYLNIWICDITSGASGGLVTLGYAYLPFGGVVGSDIDGLVLDYDYGLGNGARTATHEVGHYLGLLHPWGDGGCGSDDGMGDTPTTDDATFSCANTNLMNCSELTQYENFMDYADCSLMFTNDQAAEMNGILNGVRSGLLNSNACGTVVTGPCIPTSGGGTSENDFIDGVELGSIINTNSGSNTGPSYNDYTAQFSTTLQRTSDYTVTVTSGDYTPDNYAVWIDYNQNDAFETTEKLGEFTNASAGEAQDIAFTVPAGAALGTTVMRVRGVFFNTGEPDPAEPCFAYDYGETEDYGITITNNGGSGPCIPTSLAGTDDGDFVDGVQLGSIDNTGSGGVAGPTYNDYTAQSTDLTRGDEYTLTITSGEYVTDILGAWIDFNVNDVFEVGELLGEAQTSAPFENVDLTFTVPNDASLGTTLLRVRCVFPDDLEPTNADPCFNFTWGETEDYSVNIETNTGLHTAANDPLLAFPNPADDLLRVRIPQGGSQMAEILDPLGRVLVRRYAQTASWVMGVSALANGHYLLRCTVDGRVSTMPFSVQHSR